MDKLVETYCDVDDFCHLFMDQWQRTLLEDGDIKRRRACRLSSAEIMTIIIHFHQSHYRDLKKLLPSLCLSAPDYLLSRPAELYKVSRDHIKCCCSYVLLSDC